MSTVAAPLLHVLAYALLFAAVIGFCCWRDIAEWLNGFREELRGGTR